MACLCTCSRQLTNTERLIGNLVPKDSGCDADVVDMISFGGRGDMAFVAPEEYIDGPDYFEFNHFKDKTCEVRVTP